MAAATTGPTLQRARRHRRLIVFLIVCAALVTALTIFATAFTRLETYGDARRLAAPAWSAPCFLHQPRHDRALLARCARATGVVAHVRSEGDTHAREVHFALVGRFGALIIKLGDPATLRKPRVGSRVTVVGPLVRASNDMREIEAWSVH
jgi:hypothetical protein